MDKCFHVINVEELNKFQSPKICLVSNVVDTLINEVIDKLNHSDKLNIILTESISKLNPNPESLLSKFYERWGQLTKNGPTFKDGNTIKFKESIALTVWNNEDLKGKDLKDFKAKIMERREANNRKEKQLRDDIKKDTDSFQMISRDKSGINNIIRNNNFNRNGMISFKDHVSEDEDENDILLMKSRAYINNHNKKRPVDM